MALKDMNSTTTSRNVVFKIITSVVRKNRPLDEALDLELGNSKLDTRDRAFVRMLATTVLRRLGQIDDIIGNYVKNAIPKQAIGVEEILRIGVAQIIFLNTPAHASVDTSVRLAEALGFARYKGLINAVLRKISKEGQAIVQKQDEARLNTPEWLWQSWQNFYGKDICRKIAQANLEEPNLDITVKNKDEYWAEKLGGEVILNHTVRLKSSGIITELEGFDSGDWWIQDAAASLPVRLLGNINGLRIADLCAAPGGKTAQLITAGAIVTAIDRSKSRVGRLQDNLKRLNLSCGIINDDAQKWFEATQKQIGLFDAVLLDAPCSSTGTIKKNPDITILKTAKDITKINEQQKRLLETAFAMVKKGGTVIYSVCSLEKEEGENCVEEVLKNHPEISLKPIKSGEFETINKFGEEHLITKEGYIRTLPFYLGGVDGFFMARFVKNL